MLELEGSAAALVAVERTALNLAMRLSGIATATAVLVAELAGTEVQLADTRKTTPGWRELEKAAVLAGGGQNHRMGLWDAAMIKDNHVLVAGDVGEAVRRARDAGVQTIICEVDRLDQIEPALAAGATRLLLDNMEPDTLRQAVAMARVAGATISSFGGERPSVVRSTVARAPSRVWRMSLSPSGV